MYQFFAEFNSKLLSSSNYIIRRQAVQVCLSYPCDPLVLCISSWAWPLSNTTFKILLHNINLMIHDDLNWCVVCIWFIFQLLADILLDRSNTTVMVCYVSSKENLIVLMNLLRVRYSCCIVAMPTSHNFHSEKGCIVFFCSKLNLLLDKNIL